ncbi:MAG: class I SAM-dependent methyltransferase [Acidobacteria bacterium]|nr:class I SAM-dependent methyltransferase [Acidobacteriota bacterium]
MMNEELERTGEMWDKRFGEHPWSVVPDESLVDLVAPLNAGRALDLGCGTGRNALWLARQGWNVTGVDASQVGLKIAADQAHREKLTLTLEHADLLVYEAPPASFDLVVISNIHLAPERRDEFFARAARAVAPSGHLYITGHHVDAFGLAGPPARERLFDESMFREGFDSFTTEVLERRETLSDADLADDVVLVFWATRHATESGSHE